MSDSSIVIPHHSLIEALETATALNGRFGQDCFLEANYALKLPLAFIQKCNGQPEINPVPCQRCPVRLDRVIELEPEQQARFAEIQLAYAQDWEIAAGNRYQQQLARRKYHQLKQVFRSEVLTPLVDMEISAGVTLIYGGFFFDALCQDAPDGRFYTVETLIHFSHPVSSEDLHLRERRVECDRIIRYRILGVDDAEWIRQNEPRRALNAEMWRELLVTRLL
jgi:hypothetical protein